MIYRRKISFSEFFSKATQKRNGSIHSLYQSNDNSQSSSFFVQQYRDYFYPPIYIYIKRAGQISISHNRRNLYLQQYRFNDNVTLYRVRSLSKRPDAIIHQPANKSITLYPCGALLAFVRKSTARQMHRKRRACLSKRARCDANDVIALNNIANRLQPVSAVYLSGVQSSFNNKHN